MAGIYEPSGRAREFSPLALNHYLGCDHGCTYGYCKRIGEQRGRWSANPTPALTTEELRTTCRRHSGSQQQVLLSFMGDPYCEAETRYGLTRLALGALLYYQIPVSILTKGGERCLRDLDTFKRFGRHIQAGASLTGMDELEPGAAPNQERVHVLAELHDAGVPTWASIEPVIDCARSLAALKEALPHVDMVKIGAASGGHEKPGQDWGEFLWRALEACKAAGVRAYVKRDLRERASRVKVAPGFCDADAFQAEPWPAIKGEQAGLL